MATNTLVNDYFYDLGLGVHDFSSDTLMFMLSNTAPGAEASDPTADGNGQIANVTEIDTTNYADDMTVDFTLEGVTWALSAGVANLVVDDVVVSASGGALATWRYCYIYNNTATNKEIISVYDHGSAVNLADGESITLDFGADGGTSGEITNLQAAA